MEDQIAPPLVGCADHAFYLDLDGTLAPLVAHPDQVAIAPDMLKMVADLMDVTGGAVAILSGRPLAEIDRIIAPLRVCASGAHGAEMRGAGNVEGAADLPEKIRAQVDDFAAKHGLIVEQKAGAVALHYRSAPDRADTCKALMESLATDHCDLRVLHGKMVSEIASAACTKGTAINAFSKMQPFRGRVPVMVGDDVTDEDGFAAAQALGGIGIKIGEGPSVATYRLGSVEALHDWLATLPRQAP